MTVAKEDETMEKDKAEDMTEEKRSNKGMVSGLSSALIPQG